MIHTAIVMAKELGLTPRTLTSDHSSTRSENKKTGPLSYI
jgi:hypothetical protein